ncbi:hypothetical protein [Georgenia alba]|uniref:SurA N-terminal domain-containing protein n=1 Tax=Georgenia alba TaxID=2233858 RepID=A0ABW2Q5V5_9MICO
MTLRRSRLARCAVALAAAGAAAAGCSAQPGTAATVDGTRISENAVDDATREWVEVSGQQVSASQVAHTLVQAELFEPIAREHGFGYSDQQVTQTLTDVATSQGRPAPGSLSPAVVDLARFVLQQGEIAQSPEADRILGQLGEATDQAEIEVNPRYGTRDAAGQIVPTSYDWIHRQPEETPAPPGG